MKTNAASLILDSGEKLSVTSQLAWVDDMYSYRIAFKNEGPGPLDVSVAGVRYGYAISLYLQPGENAEYEFPTVDPPEEREALVKISDVCQFPIRVLAADSMTERLVMEEEAPFEETSGATS